MGTEAAESGRPKNIDLTVSGLILGVGIEGSSHKYGLFADTVEACEVVIGDATLVRATRAMCADLFHALPWSYGAARSVSWSR